MKLYISPGSCSLSPHIAMSEAGIPVELVKVNLGTKQTAAGEDYRAINPKGSVPALGLPEGGVLTEGAVIVQYIADQKPASHLAPPAGTMERYRLQEWLNYVSSEIHKGFSPLFNRKATDEQKKPARDALLAKFPYLNKTLEGRDYLMGSQFTVADGYLFTVLRWHRLFGIDLAEWPAIDAYVKRIEARPAVQVALAAESGIN